MNSPRAGCPAWLLACYRISLRVYPKKFRAEYGALMEQAFVDRYLAMAASGKNSVKVRFALDSLRDSGQSLCSQHWYAVEAGGFVRLRFLLLLLLFMPIALFHQNLILKASDGLFVASNLDATMWNAFNAEHKYYETELADRLRQYGDAESSLAAKQVSGQLVLENIPEGDALERMNLRIAREVMAHPFKPSLLARGSNWGWSDAHTVYMEIWPIKNAKQLSTCRKLEAAGHNNPACIRVWENYRRHHQFLHLMIVAGYNRPTGEDIVSALEHNRRDDLERHFIALNNLQNCQFADPTKNFLKCHNTAAR